MEQKSADVAVVDDAAFASVDATPLQIEKAKVQALNRQLTRSLDEKSQLQKVLKQTQVDLEKQIQQTLRLQKSQARRCIRDAMERQVPDACDDTQELKAELASTQKDLADEICMSKKRDARLQRLQDQCNSYKEQLESMKQRYGSGEGDDDKQSMEKLVKNLEHQRSALLLLVNKQMKLIDIHKQSRAHIEAAALLNITEKDFMKEVNCR